MIEASFANNAIPKRFGIVQDSKQISDVDARCSFGKMPQSRVFASGMKSPQCSSLKILNVSRNSLNNLDIEPLL